MRLERCFDVFRPEKSWDFRIRPMPVIGSRCDELRIQDQNVTWRIVYRVDSDAVIIADVFAKKTSTTPRQAIDVCKQRLANYDTVAKEQDE